MNWTDTPTGRHCNKHAADFARGEVCRACASERRAVAQVQQVDASALNESVEYDAEMLLLADEAISFSRFLNGKAEKRIADGNPNDWSASAKLIAEATKLQRFAVETKEKLSARAHSRFLVEHEKDIKGLRRKGN